MRIGKKLFISTINEMEKQRIHDDEYYNGLRALFPDTHVTPYNNEVLFSAMIKLLAKLVNDNSDWIDYYVYELGFGKENRKLGRVKIDNHKFTLKTANDLWELLSFLNRKT